MPVWGALVLAIVSAGTTPAWSADSAWRLERDRDGIRIHSRQVEGWSIREIRGQMTIDARLSSIVAVLDDVETGRELVELVSSTSIHDRESAVRYRVYSVTDMPFPLTDRDIFNQREIRQDPGTLEVTITDVATKNLMPLKKGLVRIERARQQWTLKPGPDGVLVEIIMLSDPAGPIPASLINTMAIDTPFEMLTKLAQIVKRDRYAHAKLGFVSDPGP